MNQTVTDYIENIKVDWQTEIFRRVRELVHQSIPGADERIQYSKPHFLKNGKYAVVIGPAKGWVSVTIFNATSLEAPDGLFEASDVTGRKTIKIKPGQAVDYDLLGTLMQQAASTL